MEEIEMTKEILREEDCLSFAIKRKFVWHTHDFKRRRRKQYTACVEMKLRLILYWLVEQQEVFKKCKSNPWESQHRLVITDINKKVKESSEKRKNC